MLDLRTALFAVFLLLAASALAGDLRGKVVAIADGDTLTMLTNDKRQHKIRIAGIDAPERKQPFGNRSRQNLARLAHGKEAQADCPKRDRYGRAVCKVYVDGLAWWYREYAREQPREDRAQYEFEEREARSRRWGLWADPAPVEPFIWREQRRRKR